MVGYSYTAPGVYHAFSYSSGTMTDLNSLTTNLPDGFVLDQASAINSLGDIAGYGENSLGQDEAFLLTPTPEPASLALLAVAGLGMLLLKRGRKLGVRS